MSILSCRHCGRETKTHGATGFHGWWDVKENSNYDGYASGTCYQCKIMELDTRLKALETPVQPRDGHETEDTTNNTETNRKA